MDERLHKLHEMVNRGIDEITTKSSLDKDTVCVIGELVDIKKDIATIEAMEEYGYSETGMPGYYENSYGGNGYGYNNSYARGGRGRSRGRYSRGGNGSYGYSRDDDKEKMIRHLEQAMDNAPNEHEREKIRRMIMQIEEE